MRRLPGFLLVALATLIVLVALLVSGLRFILPHIERFHPKIVNTLSEMTGATIEIGAFQGSWQSFGPTLEIRAFVWKEPQQTLRIARITVALDIWQSLLRWRWQFRDLTFYNLQLDNDKPLRSLLDGKGLGGERLAHIFLYQFDHFTLRNSRINFLSPSGERLQLEIPQLTWLNTQTRHRAQGEVGVFTPSRHYGYLQLRIDLRDKEELLSNGQIYLQADEIDLKPWLNRWINHNMGLTGAKFSLATWLTIENGEVNAGTLWVNQGRADWTEGANQHHLNADHLAIQMKRIAQGWRFDLPVLNLATNGIPWPKGRLSALYPAGGETDSLVASPQKILLIRAENLQLESITPLAPMFAFLQSESMVTWQHLQPKGQISQLALDIPLTRPERSHFMLEWQGVSWQPWKLWPGINHFNGHLSGDLDQIGLSFSLKNSTLPYDAMFRAPLEVKQANGSGHFVRNDQGWFFSSHDLMLKTDALWLQGEVRYQHPQKGEPQLSILSGIRLSDTREAWRYFPEPLMGKALVDYLRGALEGGHVDNATLVYEGNPHHFPYRHHDGHFQVYAPLREATFRFQPNWPALTQLNINLDFRNDGLWMQIPSTQLGDAMGYDIQGIIPQYQQEKLLIEAKISGSAKSVHDYFKLSPLAHSVAATLTELQLDGNITGHLHLNIPFNGDPAHASGEVMLHHNHLFIKPLSSALSNVSGTFRFYDEKLSSDPMTGLWFGQPVDFHFTTAKKEKAYLIDVALAGNWLSNKLPKLPDFLATQFRGAIPWKAQANIVLPYQGSPAYQAQVNADLKSVSSHLPMPFYPKVTGITLPMQLAVAGDLNRFRVTGKVGQQNHFNSELTLQPTGVQLRRGVWRDGGNQPPMLPSQDTLLLELPAFSAEPWIQWLMPLITSSSNQQVSKFGYPDQVILKTPELDFAGQQWHKLQLTLSRVPEGTHISVKGSEIDGQIIWDRYRLLQADFSYLYYNPAKEFVLQSKLIEPNQLLSSLGGSFNRWPSMQLTCKDCWIKGQRLNKVEANVQVAGNTLLLKHGLIDTGSTRVVLQGSWQQMATHQQTSLQGDLTGGSISESTYYFGLKTPLQHAPFDINFALHWQGTPWQPQIKSLNGTLDARLGKGEIDNLSGGRAGQLLRLVSFDALLRKLQLDFHDTFGKAFYFDSIRGHATIKKGFLETDDVLIDGLEADVAMTGSIDLRSQQMHLQAVIAPAISTTVGVATAFAVNPVVGAAVFAASKALGTLWNKISLIRYIIEGPLDNPTIREVVRQPKGG